MPLSRHNPQFNKDTLPNALREAGMEYLHLPGLGEFRHAKSARINLGWRNASFRAYADYMQMPEFSGSLDEMIRLANRRRSVLMCAEAVPWCCHRLLIAWATVIMILRERCGS